MYEELNANINRDELMQDPNYRKIVDVIESGQPESESDLETVTEDAEGLVMTQEGSIPLDPLTKLPVTDPVINKICHHTYDKASILQHIASRKNQARLAKLYKQLSSFSISRCIKDIYLLIFFRCPMSGCANRQTLHASDLEENVEMKRIINRKRAGDTSFFN